MLRHERCMHRYKSHVLVRVGTSPHRSVYTRQRDGQFDDIVIGEDMSAKILKDTLEGRKIVELRRRGKQMWFVLDK